LEDCQKKLDEMPAPLTVDPTTEIINRVTGFSAAVSGAVSGDGLKSLAQRNRKLYDEWKQKIRGTAPDFRPFVNQNQYSKPSWPDQEVATEPDVPVETFDLTKVREVIDK
jgi:vacuolar protein sorting-associated protein 1